MIFVRIGANKSLLLKKLGIILEGKGKGKGKEERWARFGETRHSIASPSFHSHVWEEPSIPKTIRYVPNTHPIYKINLKHSSNRGTFHEKKRSINSV